MVCEPEVIVKLPEKRPLQKLNEPLPMNVPGYGPAVLPLTSTLAATRLLAQLPALPLPAVELSVSGPLILLTANPPATVWAAQFEFAPKPTPRAGVTFAVLLQPASMATVAQMLSAYCAEIEIRIAPLLGVDDAILRFVLEPSLRPVGTADHGQRPTQAADAPPTASADYRSRSKLRCAMRSRAL